VNRDELRRWLSAYERVWRADAVLELEGLFAADATYLNAPFAEPYRGLDAIAAMWPEEDGAASTVDFEIVAVEGNVGVVRADVRYSRPRPQRFLDLWIVTLGRDGRAVAFEEWPFWPPGSEGGFDPGPPRVSPSR
jgi:SnoaL-like protein